MSKKTKVRKIFDLDVQEISLVDAPANGIPILLYKRAKSPAGMPAALVEFASQPNAMAVTYDSANVLRILHSL